MRIPTAVSWMDDGYKNKLFASEPVTTEAIKPSDKDNFIVHKKDYIGTFKEYKCGSPEIVHRPHSRSKPRVKSASSVRLQDRPWRKADTPTYPNGFVPKPRPESAKPRPPSAKGAPNRRIKSAGSARTRAEANAQANIAELRKGFALVNNLYEHSYCERPINLHPASPAPDYRYYDRHTRCYHSNPMRYDLLCDRPLRTSTRYLEAFGSRASSPSHREDPHGQPQRYIDYHRPHTAPGTRKELQFIPSPSFIFRGRVPHFCNFVRSLPLHSKADLDTTDLLEDSELGDEVDLVAESAEGSQIGQWRKGSGDSSIPEQKEDGVTSGFEGRPASPSSQGDQDNADLGGLTEEDEDEKMTSSPVTGVEVRVTPSRTRTHSSRLRKLEVNLLHVNKDAGFESSAPDSSMTIPEVVTPPPPELPSDAWGMSNKHLSDTLIPSGQSTDDNGERSDSPRQPPPTPEPKPPETPPPSKRRACVSKKTKKPIERLRKKKEMEVPPEIQSPVVVETEPTTPAEDESAKKDFKIELKVPDLPPPQEKKERHLSAQSKVKKHLIQAETDLDLQNQDASDQSDSQLNSYQDYDLSGMETNGLDDIKQPPQIKSWIKGRLALSQQSSRFELPMDMKRLETMTPQEYIKAYCIITSRRQNLYQKIFFKNKDKSATILFKDIEKTLKDVLVNTITSDQVEDVLQLLEVTEQTKIDYKLFSGMAAYSERVLYPKFVTEDTHDMPEYQREKIECADFSALDWKFHGINVNPAILKMLRRIS